MESDG